MKKIISYSLWGNNERYTHGALRNSELASEIYPDWICRFYIGKSVPDDIIKSLKKKDNTQLILMNKPGMKVFHVQDIDFRSHNSLFSEALYEIKEWSDNHPDHIPIIITMNLKDEVIDRPGFQTPLPFSFFSESRPRYCADAPVDIITDFAIIS